MVDEATRAKVEAFIEHYDPSAINERQMRELATICQEKHVGLKIRKTEVVGGCRVHWYLALEPYKLVLDDEEVEVEDA